MPELFITLAVIVVVIYATSLIINAVQIKKVKEKLNNICNNKSVQLSVGKKTNRFDYLIVKDNNKYYVKLCFIPSNSCVTINYKDTFNLKYGGNKNQLGRSYPKERYLNELVGFLNSNYDGKKVVLFCPSTEQVLKYLNESDIGIVTYADEPYGMKVMNFEDFVVHFDEIVL